MSIYKMFKVKNSMVYYFPPVIEQDTLVIGVWLDAKEHRLISIATKDILEFSCVRDPVNSAETALQTPTLLAVVHGHTYLWLAVNS